MRRLAALLLFLAAVPTYAYRREYRVTLDGTRKPGSEVCFYEGTSGRNPFELFFSYTTVRCLPADDVLDFPPGLFHAFARHHDGFVSAYRDYFVYRGDPAPERGYRQLEIPLAPAAFVDMTAVLKELHPGEAAGVWIAPTPTRAGTFFPLVNGENTIMVPAGEPLLPLLIANHQPIAIGQPLVLDAGAHERVLPFRDGTAVVAWVKLDHDAAHAAPDSMTTPDVTLTLNGNTAKPLFPLYHTDSTNTLLFFLNPPQGRARLELHGRFWAAVRRDITVPQRGLLVEQEPLLLTPAGSLLLTWTSPAADGPAPECQTVPPGLHDPMRAAVEFCPTPEHCQRVAMKPAAPDAHAITFDGLAAGHYRALVKPPGMSKPIAQFADVLVSRETTLAMPLEEFRFFGTVTLNGSPLPARIFFDTGETVTDPTGRYTASLPASPRTSLIRVLGCADGRVHTFVPRESMQANTSFDIALQVAPLHLAVRDDARAVVADADVWYTSIKEADTAFYSSPRQKTDASGQAAFDAVPTDQKIRVCATKQGFEISCTPAQSATTTLLLHRLALQGKVTNHDGTGFLAAVDPQGHLTELVQVAMDGSFGFQRSHAAPEYLVYTASRRPLAVLPLTLDPATQQLILTVPDAPTRSFTVSVTTSVPDGFVGLWIGNAYVPLQMLAFHEEARGQDIVLHHGGRLALQDILETAPISAAFGAASKEVIDVFTLPEYAGVHRQLVTHGEIVLTP